MGSYPHYSNVFSPYYQTTFIINNTSLLPGQHPSILDFMVSDSSSFGPDYSCSNCQCYGFPCANCKDYIIDGKPLLTNISDEFIIDFSEQIPTPSTHFSSMSFIDQIDFIASRNIAWADVPDDY